MNEACKRCLVSGGGECWEYFYWGCESGGFVVLGYIYRRDGRGVRSIIVFLSKMMIYGGLSESCFLESF
jgi:hypothetical protein